MNGHEELEHLRTLLQGEVDRSTAADVAREAHVSERNLSNFLSGEVKVPRGTTLHALRKWRDEHRTRYRVAPRERKKVAEPPPDVLAAAAKSTGENLVRLSKIAGYAESVLDMMRSVTEQQVRVVESLAPWVTHEADSLAAGLEKVTQTASARVRQSRKSPESSRPDTAPKDPRTKRPPDDGANESGSRRQA